MIIIYDIDFRVFIVLILSLFIKVLIGCMSDQLCSFILSLLQSEIFLKASFFSKFILQQEKYQMLDCFINIMYYGFLKSLCLLIDEYDYNSHYEMPSILMLSYIRLF